MWLEHETTPSEPEQKMTQGVRGYLFSHKPQIFLDPLHEQAGHGPFSMGWDAQHTSTDDNDESQPKRHRDRGLENGKDRVGHEEKHF